MNLIKENTAFVKVDKIFFVKSNTYKLGKYKFKEGTLKGKIDVILEFFDSETRQIDTKINFDFNIEINEDVLIEDVRIIDLKLHTIDNLGVDCVYTLDITTKPRINKTSKEKPSKEELVILNDENNKMEEETIIEKMKIQNAINEGLKQELTNSYDKLLEENLEKRETIKEDEIQEEKIKEEQENQEIEVIVLNEQENHEKLKEIVEENFKKNAITDLRNTKDIDELNELVESEEILKKEEVIEGNKNIKEELAEANKIEEKVAKVEIISTMSKSSESDFISFFNSFETRYFNLKTIYCQSEEDLNKISKDYNIPIENLLKSYDRNSKSVVIKNDSK